MSIARMLKSIDIKKSKLETLRPISKEQTQNLKQLYDVDFTYNSNAIEGSTLSFSETKLILNEGLTIGGKKLSEHLEVINHQEAIGFIESLSHLKPKDIKLKDILDIHYLILNKISSQDAGVFRSRGVGVQKSNGEIHEFIEPLKIDEAMQEFLEWLKNSDEHPIVLSALAHLKLVSIHPFIDGNGRTARLLMNLILLQQGYPIAVIEMKNRAKYIQTIEKAQQSSQTEDFYRVVAEAVGRSIDKHLKILTKDITLI
ncbi:MAG: Fic family protein [Sulfurimonas sp.]|nr:Fic family protein [Sulfurimonas sp.]